MFFFSLQSNGRSEDDISEPSKHHSSLRVRGKGKRKPIHKDVKSVSMLDGGSHTVSTEMLTGDGSGPFMEPNPSLPDYLQRSVSLDPLPYPSTETPVGPQIPSSAHRAISPVGISSFQGYMKMKQRREDKWTRYWCILEDLTIRCHTSQNNLSLVHHVPLRGSTITQADEEAKRKYSFRVWNSESRLCYYFSAYEEKEFQEWFSEVVDGAEQLSAEVSKKTGSKGSSSPVFYFSKEGRARSYSNTSKNNPGSMGSLNVIDHSDGDSGSIASSGQQGALVAYQGQLKRRGEKLSWNTLYCQVKESQLLLFYSSSEQVPINALPLRECSLERINLPPHEVERYAFTVAVQGITYTFAAPNDQALHGWLQAIQACINTTQMSTPTTTKIKRNRNSSRKEKSRSEVFGPSMIVAKALNPSATASTMVRILLLVMMCCDIPFVIRMEKTEYLDCVHNK